MLISQAFQKYIEEDILLFNGSEKTAKNYGCTLNSFLGACGDIPISSLSREHLHAWMVYMTEQGNKPSSQHGNLGHLRKVLRFVSSLGIEVYDANSIKSPRVHRTKPTVLNHEEITRLIQATDNLRDRLLISFLASTLCRISEALSVNRRDINGDCVEVVGKNHKFRRVYLDERTLILLEQYLSTRYDELAPLFITSQDTRMTVSRAEQIFRAAADKAGINKRVYPHLIRHSEATSLMEQGMHSRVLQTVLGHEHLGTTERYMHVSERFAKESYKQYHKI